MNARTLAVSVALAFCACHTGAPSTGPAPSRTDAAVYAAVLDSLWPSGSVRKVLVLADMAYPDGTLSREDLAPGFPNPYPEQVRALPGIDTALVTAFRMAAASAPISLRPIEATLQQLVSSRLIMPTADEWKLLSVDPSPDDTLTTDTERYWKRFGTSFPGAVGAISLSRVAFNADRTQALLAVHIGCGSLCGRGRVVWVKMIDRRWRIQGVVGTWVS